MGTAVEVRNAVWLAGHGAAFPPLNLETRSAVTTEAAAYYLNRKPQTLRAWACFENGPLRPIRINGRLSWRVADIQAVLNGAVVK